jgi:hypothetical protein
MRRKKDYIVRNSKRQKLNDIAMFFFFLATGIADIVRTAFRRSLNRFISGQTSYDSDVFRYTQLSQRGMGGLYSGRYEYLSTIESNVLS